MTNLELLQEEYKQLCADWRMRDDYIQTKFIRSVFVYSLLGAAVGWLFEPGQDHWPFLIGVLALGIGYTVIMLVSVAKDTYYRNGTAEAIEVVLKALETCVDPASTTECGSMPPSKLLVENCLYLYQPHVLRSIGPKSPSGSHRLRTTQLIRVFYALVLMILFALTAYSIWKMLYPSSEA